HGARPPGEVRHRDCARGGLLRASGPAVSPRRHRYARPGLRVDHEAARPMSQTQWPNAQAGADDSARGEAVVAVKSSAELALMREAGRIVCEVLDALEAACQPKVTTWELDRLAADLTAKKKAKPAF